MQFPCGDEHGLRGLLQLLWAHPGPLTADAGAVRAAFHHHQETAASLPGSLQSLQAPEGTEARKRFGVGPGSVCLVLATSAHHELSGVLLPHLPCVQGHSLLRHSTESRQLCYQPCGVRLQNQEVQGHLHEDLAPLLYWIRVERVDSSLQHLAVTEGR